MVLRKATLVEGGFLLSTLSHLELLGIDFSNQSATVGSNQKYHIFAG